MEAVLDKGKKAGPAKGKRTPAKNMAETQLKKGAPAESATRAGSGSARSDVIVTARVPSEIRDQGNAVLKKIGATPTDLVNAAYRYVLERGELPKTTPSLKEVALRRKTLTPEQKREVKERIERTTLPAPASWQGKTFDELREEAMRERYPEFFE